MAKKSSILVVDDEEAALQVLREALEGAGHSVRTAQNGAEAWKYLDSTDAKEIALIVTDLVMPKMDGMELARKVSQTFPSLPILFTSGYADDIVYEGKELASVVGFLPKPFDIETLRRRVREALAR